MAKGLSLHIGLNRVDPNHYQDGNGNPWDGALTACEADAHDMAALAKKRSMTLHGMLLSPAATADTVRGAILDAAKILRSGDLFFLTYSGHGGQVPDTNHDEKQVPYRQRDRMDETWVLYDRELIDDELYVLWAKFKAGVRIVVLSDSCHSGTVVRATPMPGASGGRPRRVRMMPPAAAARTYAAHKRLYDGIQKLNPTAEKSKVRASVILISGCQDNQTSEDGDRNGLFTANLRAVWKNGAFKGTYQALRDRIAAQMPDTQTPNYFVVGARNPKFEAQTPFTI